VFAPLGRRSGGTNPTSSRPITPRERTVAAAIVLMIVALMVVAFPERSSAADKSRAITATPGLAPEDFCDVQEWQSHPDRCIEQLKRVTDREVNCLEEPSPATPDSGLAGWFASRPEASRRSGTTGLYTDHGYAGYSYTTYDQCFAFDSKFENTVANGEIMLATAIVGASNALREKAWDPGSMWAWADPLVETSTRTIYEKVFTPFGAVTLVLVGLYLLWRSRQAEMSWAVTTSGWAILVMVVVTALYTWPIFSANIADKALVTSLGTIHDAVGPPKKELPPDQCPLPDKNACRDERPPALRASDNAVGQILYENWLRGLLGSADSATAKKYGRSLYDARTIDWREQQSIRDDPALRDVVIERKAAQWRNFAGRIKEEDPAAYEYLTGSKGMERIGAGFIALLSAVMFALFDITASLLVLLGFVIFRWAVIAAPIIGTVAILRPASAGFRRLVNAVVAALFNIVIFGAGAAIYLFAFDLIMGAALPGWLQVVLVWLCGVVGWLLLRPYRRITQLGGRDPSAVVASAGSWHRRFFRDIRETAPAAAAKPGGGSEIVVSDRPPQRIEVRAEAPLHADGPVTPPSAPSATPTRRMPTPSGGGWQEPDTAPAPSYTLYRPSRSTVTATEARGDITAPDAAGRTRAEARLDR
jgi:hypothetical protein